MTPTKIFFFLLIKKTIQDCFPTTNLIEFEINFNDKTGPLKKVPLDYQKMTTEKFSLSTWIKYQELDTDQTGKTITPIQIGYIDTNNITK